jgi:hypothetical protein
VSLPRLLSAVAPLALSAAVLAIGTAAAPDRDERAPRGSSPRLVARPVRIAPALLLAPGDHVQRLIELRKRGRGRFAAVYLAVRTRRRSQLSADRLHGLHVELRSCARRWRRLGTGYRCAERATVVLATRSLLGRTRLKGLRLQGSRPVHLRLLVSLPRGAGSALKGRRTSVVYSFVGIARGRR